MTACEQELCPNWTGQGCICAVDPFEDLSAVFAPLGAWARDAACAVPDVDPTIFDEGERGDGIDQPTRRAMQQRAAEQFCAACPVQRECLADAEANDLTGVRGGVLIYRRGELRRELLGDALPSAA